MRRALLVAAKPLPVSGPCVPLDGSLWAYQPPFDFGGALTIHINEGLAGSRPILVYGTRVEFEANNARAEITAEIESAVLVTVDLERVA